LYEFNTAERGINFVRNLGDKPVMAWIDRVNFDKVISNLLSNAFKYTSDKGDVIISLIDNSDSISIKVADSGKGINNAEKSKIFDRFYQSADSKQGTGIGLHICHDITILHGGHIAADNRTDGVQGAVFTVTLPKGNAHLKPEQIISSETSEPAQKTPSSNRLNIIIADDDKEIADFIISLNLKPDDISTVLDLFAFYGMTLRYFKSRFIVNRVQSYITSGLEVLSIYGPLYINCEYQEVDLERIDEIRQGKKVLYPSDEEMLVVYVHPFCDKDKDSDQNIDKMEHEAVRRWTTKHGRYAPKTLKEEFIMDAFKIDKNTIVKSTRIGFRSSEPTLNIVRKSLDISKYLEGI
jgi:hypothetical protein